MYPTLPGIELTTRRAPIPRSHSQGLQHGSFSSQLPLQKSLLCFSLVNYWYPWKIFDIIWIIMWKVNYWLNYFNVMLFHIKCLVICITFQYYTNKIIWLTYHSMFVFFCRWVCRLFSAFVVRAFVTARLCPARFCPARFCYCAHLSARFCRRGFVLRSFVGSPLLSLIQFFSFVDQLNFKSWKFSW